MKNIGLKDQPINLEIQGSQFILKCNTCGKLLHQTERFGIDQDKVEEARALIELYADPHRCPGTRFARLLITFACAIGAEQQLVDRLRAENRIH